MLGSGPRRLWFMSNLALGALAALGGVVVGGPMARAAEATILLLDASNSMNSNFDGDHRINAVKQAISENIPRYDTQLKIGMVAFGNREQRSCSDVETLVAPGPNNASSLVIATNGIKAQGVSLLGQAMLRAATDADHKQNPTSIIAMVDGAGVKACGVDACQAAAELNRDAKDLTVHVIALSPKPADVPALECVASTTGGTYVTVANARQVRNALDLALRATLSKAQSPASAAVAPAPKRKPKPPVLADNAPAPLTKPDPAVASAGAPASDGIGTAPAEPGAAPGEVDNTVSFAPTRPAGNAPVQNQVAQNPATPSPRSGADNLVVMAPTAANQPPASGGQNEQKVASAPGTTVLYRRPAKPKNPAPGIAGADAKPTVTAKAADPAGAQNSTTAGGGLTMVPADQAAVTPAAPAAAGLNVQVTAAPATGTTPSAGSGAVRLAAMIVANAKPVPEGMMWQIFQEAQGGGRGPLALRSSDPSPVLKLPAGRYVVEGRFGNALREMPMVIEADKQTEANLVLDVGGLQLVPAVAGATNTDADITNAIYAADNLQTPIVANATAGAVIYLSAGRYRIVSRYGNANSIAEDDIQVQRGKLTQAKINHRAAPISFRLVQEAGGTPVSGASWLITDQAGTTIKQSDEAAPTYVLVEGTYQIAVSSAGQTYRKTFAVAQGVAATVEILAK